jgi:hypothetical protein
METEKKQWTQPKLTVLVRSKREEAVLVACKYLGISGPGHRDIACNIQGWCELC